MTANEYLPIAVIGLLGILLPFVIIGIGRLIRPYKPQQDKYEIFECGEITIGTTRIPFSVQYYIYALIFVIFDVETIFLFPWAVSFVKLGLLGFIEMMLFLGILVVGLAYAWKKGALEWSI